MQSLIRKGEYGQLHVRLVEAAGIDHQIPQKDNFFLQLPHGNVDDAVAFAFVVALLLLREDEPALPFRQLLKEPLHRKLTTKRVTKIKRKNQSLHLHSKPMLQPDYPHRSLPRSAS